MDPTHDIAQLNKLRWAIGINGVLAIAFGVVILVWPSISLYALTILFGAYTLAAGIVGLVAMFRADTGRAWMAVWSLLSIGVGLAVLFWPSISALALLYVIGAYAIAIGVVVIGGAFWLPLRSSDALIFTLSGIVAVLFGIVMFAKPGDGALVLLALIAAFMLVFGITQLIVAIGGPRLVERELRSMTRATA